jgi:hypothetical protein
MARSLTTRMEKDQDVLETGELLVELRRRRDQK